MANTFRNILLSVVFASLFIFLFVSFAIDIGSDYGKDVSDLTDNKLNLSGIQDTLNQANSTATTWKNIFASQNVISLVVGIVVSGLKDLALTMYSFAITPFTLFMNIMTNVLHVPAIVTGVLIFTLIVVIIFAVWSLIVKGD